MKTEWKPVKGFEGEYEVSNFGQVRSCDRMVRHAKGGQALKRGKILKISNDGHGYPMAILYRESHGHHFSVHRLVAQCFVDNPFALPQVNHIDGNPANPESTNLEWVTHADNLRHARDVLKRWTTGYHQPRSPRHPKVRAAA